MPGTDKKREALVVIVSAPSGSGKTTIVSELLEKMPDVKRSISFTTRPPREGEEDKQDYIFVSKEEFDKKIEQGDFLEWEKNFDNFYGTSKKQIEEALASGTDIILSIDVKGARKVKEAFPGSISVFIMPPSVEELVSRLRNRNTDQENQVSIRLKESRKEIESSDEYDYMIINKDLAVAVEELSSIINMERKNRDRTKKKVEEK